MALIEASPPSTALASSSSQAEAAASLDATPDGGPGRAGADSAPAGGHGNLASAQPMLSLERKIAFIVLSAVAISVLLLFLRYRGVAELETNSDWTEHTHKVLLTLRNIETALLEAESGVRGYLITGDKAYLAHYTGVAEAVDKEVSEFRRLISDNPEQRANVSIWEPLVATKLARLRNTVKEYDKHGALAALGIVRSNVGKRVMDEIRRVGHDIEVREQGLLKQRQAAEAHSLAELTLFMSLAIAFYGLFLTGVSFVIHRELRYKRATEEALRESEKRVRAIADNMPAHITYVDREQRYRFSNHYPTAKSGMEPDEMLGRTMAEVLPKSRYKDIAHYVAAALSGQRVRFESTSSRAGHLYHEETHYIPDLPGDGTVRGFYGMSFDVSERKAAEETLFREHERMQVTLSSIGDAVVTTDVGSLITYLNPVAESMTGWDNASAHGLPLEQVFRVINSKSRAAVPSPLAQALREDRIIRLPSESVLVRRDSSELGIEDSAAPIHDRAGNVIGGVLAFNDVSDARAMALRVQHQVYHDTLTGLPNRALLRDRLAQAIASASRNSARLAVLFLDLDRLKQLNDTLGHARGDEVLKEIALRLAACVRASDTVSRIGGDEFVVLLPEINDALRVAQIADKLRAAVAEPYNGTGDDVPISVSIGISIYPDDGAEVDALLRSADAAMYEAKALGGNSCQFFTAEMNARAVNRERMEMLLRQALVHREFTLYFQPKVSYPSRAVVGAEALIRWHRSDGTRFAPAEFIPLAEETGLIVAIGQWVMRSACEQIMAWQKAGATPVPVSVNVSAIQLRQKEFFADVEQVLAETGIDPALLELELTESVLMGEEMRFPGLMESLVRLGVRLSIDDFGTGYSSLSYLKRFPMSTLKIDQSFVHDVTTDPDDAIITLTIINLAGSLGLEVIAEGVETEEQAVILFAQGCALMQGYYFGFPMPASEFALLLAADGSAPQVDLSTTGTRLRRKRPESPA